eukprot:gene11382-8099_t
MKVLDEASPGMKAVKHLGFYHCVAASVFVDGFFDLANVNSTDRDPDVLDEEP